MSGWESPPGANEASLVEAMVPAQEQRRFDFPVERRRSLRARYYYGMIFLFSNLVAWFVRDYGQKTLPVLRRT